MNLQTASSKTDAIGGIKAHYLTAVFSTALAVTAIAGIGAWQAKSDDSASRTAGGEQHVATSIDARRTGTSGDLAPQHSRSFVYYLVGSQDQAGLLESQMQAPGSDLGTEGPLLEQRAVVVVNSPEDEIRVRQEIAGANDIAAEFKGAPAFQVIDLRAQ